MVKIDEELLASLNKYKRAFGEAETQNNQQNANNGTPMNSSPLAGNNADGVSQKSWNRTNAQGQQETVGSNDIMKELQTCQTVMSGYSNALNIKLSEINMLYTLLINVAKKTLVDFYQVTQNN